MLHRLIEELSVPGADTAELEARIWKLFGERWAIVFTDMAGFSRRSARHGIVPFLALIHQLDAIIGPIIYRNAGFVMKRIADSQIILFRDAATALGTCVEMQRALHRRNEGASEFDQIFLGCGIGFGDVIKVGDDDVFGVEVNFAAKLGEDLAGPYDIFLTPAAVEGAKSDASDVQFRRIPKSQLGGTKLPYFEAVYRMQGPDRRPKAKAERVRFR